MSADHPLFVELLARRADLDAAMQQPELSDDPPREVKPEIRTLLAAVLVAEAAWINYVRGIESDPPPTPLP